MKGANTYGFWRDDCRMKMLGMGMHPRCGSRRTCANRVRAIIAAAACVGLLSACVMAPGMRMAQNPTVPVKTGDASAPPISVPITEIDLDLVKQLRAGVRDGESDRIRSLLSEPQAYLLGPGDVLQITVWDHPELATAAGPQPQAAPRPFDPVQGFVIDDQGDLQFPYAGTVHAAGLTIAQLRQRLHGLLSKVFQRPQVTVRIASFRSKQVYVEGQVHVPGAVPINDIPTTVYEAINRAGGFTANADESRLELLRGGVAYPLDLARMAGQAQSPRDILLRNGDVLRVSTRADNGAFVLGEVNRPVTALPKTNGALTLSDALAQAGSINSSSADAAEIYVIRGSLSAKPAIYHLDAKSPVAMVLANEFDLRPKDIVYVDNNGLVRFNRFLTLLLPAINAGLTGAIVTK